MIKLTRLGMQRMGIAVSLSDITLPFTRTAGMSDPVSTGFRQKKNPGENTP